MYSMNIATFNSSCLFLRYVGQDDWFRVDKRGKFSWDFLNHKNTPIEEVDLSHSLINFTGLQSLGIMFIFAFPLLFTEVHCEAGHWQKKTTQPILYRRLACWYLKTKRKLSMP